MPNDSAPPPADTLRARVAAAIAILDRDLPEWDDGWGWAAHEALEALRGRSEGTHLQSLGGADALLSSIERAALPDSVREPLSRARRAVKEAIMASLRDVPLPALTVDPEPR
jgi:hypothetical protein